MGQPTLGCVHECLLTAMKLLHECSATRQRCVGLVSAGILQRGRDSHPQSSARVRDIDVLQPQPRAAIGQEQTAAVAARRTSGVGHACYLSASFLRSECSGWRQTHDLLRAATRVRLTCVALGVIFYEPLQRTGRGDK